MKSNDGKKGLRPGLRAFGFMSLCLVLLLGWLFREALKPEIATFNNDTPLGVLNAKWVRGLDAMTGVWQDSNWLGLASVSAIPNVTRLFLSAAGPLYSSKFYAAFTLFFAGICAWYCFRRWKFAEPVCVLAGLAVVLHGNYLPNSCWGVGSQVIGFGLSFLAIGFLTDQSPRTRWVSVALAGMAVGLGVTEAFDIGALFSLVVAAFVVMQAISSEGPVLKNVFLGGIRLVLVAGAAGFIAAGSVGSLVGTQIQGVSNMGQDAESRQRRWEEATMWSTYPGEMIGVLVPAFYGFRMDTPNGGEYWGRGGRVDGWDRYLAGGPVIPGDIVRVQAAGVTELAQPRQFQVDAANKLSLPGIEPISVAGLSHEKIEGTVKAAFAKIGATSVMFQVEMPRGFIKYGGGGGYAGAVVIVLAMFALFQAARGGSSVFTAPERRLIWFWFLAAVVSLLLSFGKFAPFYQFFYALPYANTMRIPGKFGHIFAWATLILFAYGAQGLWRRYVESAPGTTRGLMDQWRMWLSKAGLFEKRWIAGSVVAFVLALAAWGLYANGRKSTEDYIARVNFFEMITQGQQPDAEVAAQDAAAQMNFSLKQSAKAIVFFGCSLGLVAVCLTGFFAAARGKVIAVLLGLVLLAELVPASAPWVVTYNWKEKYVDQANNPVMDVLRKAPHESRVAISSGTLSIPLGILDGVYGGDWKQHLFQYYNIQTTDIVQMPRPPVEVQMWEGAMRVDSPENLHVAWRRWQLMNVRYLLTRAGVTDGLNQQLKPNAPFRELMRFDFYQSRPGGPVLTTTTGDRLQFALVEYTGALPRAKLYSQWQINTNDVETLQTLRSLAFDPATSVIVADPIALPASTNAGAGTVEFTSYDSKQIKFSAKAAAASVLLLNDKFDPNWRVYVNGKSAPLLRCNYTMRGVQLPAGDNAVEFRYEPPLKGLYVSLAATGALLLLVGCLVWMRKQEQPANA
jgi:hypothetical protein